MDFLTKNYPFIYSSEPSNKLYSEAVKKFTSRNVELFNGVSEVILPSLLSKLKGDINFWLDEYYSFGVIFKGGKDCPVEDELAAIKINLSNFDSVTIKKS